MYLENYPNQNSPTVFTDEPPCDSDGVRLKHAGEVVAGKLASLVAVENPRWTIPSDGFFKRFHTEIHRHADRHPMRQNPPGRPVDDGAR
jgi:hypothetical protein